MLRNKNVTLAKKDIAFFRYVFSNDCYSCIIPAWSWYIL